jgi:hypothetical protein
MGNRSKVVIATFFMLAIAIFNSSAGSFESNDSELSEVVRQTQAIYKENGLSGLIALSKDCFSAPKPNLRCVQMDIAASMIDAKFAKLMGIRQHPYYEQDSFFQRATPIFVRSGMSMQQSNEYLANTAEIISRKISAQAMKEH